MEPTDQRTHDTLLPMAVHTATLENTAYSIADWIILRDDPSLDDDLFSIFESEARRLRRQLLDEIALSQWTPGCSTSAAMPRTLDLLNIFGEQALPLMTPVAMPAAGLAAAVLSLVDGMLARLQTEGARALRREEWRLVRAATARQAAFETKLEEQEAVLRRWTHASLDAQGAVLGTHYRGQLGAQKASFELQDQAREMQAVKARAALREEWAARVKCAQDEASALRTQVCAEKEVAGRLQRKVYVAEGRSAELDTMLRALRGRTTEAEAIQKKAEGELLQASRKIHELKGELDIGKTLDGAKEAARTEAEVQLRQTMNQVADLKAKLASQIKLATTEGEMRQVQDQQLAQMKTEVAELNNNLILERKRMSMQRDTQSRLQAELTACQTQLKEVNALNTSLQERVQDRFLRIAELKSSLIAERNTSCREEALRTAQRQMHKQDQDYGKLREQSEEQNVYVAQLLKENQDMVSTLAPILERFMRSFTGSRPSSDEKKTVHGQQRGRNIDHGESRS